MQIEVRSCELRSDQLSALWVSRTGSASDWCALQKALYKCIETIQYNTIQCRGYSLAVSMLDYPGSGLKSWPRQKFGLRFLFHLHPILLDVISFAIVRPLLQQGAYVYF